MPVKVRIEFFGKYKLMATKKEEYIEVEPDIKKAYAMLRKYLRKEYGIGEKCTIMYNKMHIQRALKEEQKVKEHDVFRVIPFLSGG